MPKHPLVEFLKEYWPWLLTGVLFAILGLNAFYLSMENKALKATLKNATATISNYETAAKDNLQTISALEAANLAWANAANANDVIVSEQIAALDAKQAALAKKEESLQRELEKAHAQNKQYSDAVVPPAVSRRLRENSRTD